MARYSSRMALRPINRIKHVVDLSATVTAAATVNYIIASATDTPTLGVPNSVETGSKINGVYMRFEVASNQVTEAGAIPNFYFYVWKNPGGNLTGPAPNNVGVSDNKNKIIHQEMKMLENQVSGNPRTIFDGVIVIPKGMRRMAPNDILEIRTLCPAIDTAQCVQIHYKEFR